MEQFFPLPAGLYPFAIGVEKQDFPEINGKGFCTLADAVACVAHLVEGGEAGNLKTVEDETVNALIDVS